MSRITVEGIKLGVSVCAGIAARQFTKDALDLCPAFQGTVSLPLLIGRHALQAAMAVSAYAVTFEALDATDEYVAKCIRDYSKKSAEDDHVTEKETDNE